MAWPKTCGVAEIGGITMMFGIALDLWPIAVRVRASGSVSRCMPVSLLLLLWLLHLRMVATQKVYDCCRVW